ncbi:MAG: universal stress protein [Caulobacteraceae bacterium]
MSFKSILIHVRPEPSSDALVRFAAAFAQDQKAELTGLGARVAILIADPGYGYLDASTVQAVIDQEEIDLEKARARFTAVTQSLQIKAHWKTHRDFPNSALVEEAAGADLIIADRQQAASGYGIDLGALVCEAGLPVLVLASETPALPIKSILVAWRNTRESRRALSGALPLLKQAERVRLVQVASDRDADLAREGLRAATDRLIAHGVKADCEVRRCNESVAATLIDEANAIDADLLVLGAYGHARAREWVLGGVTHDLLADAPLPLFLVH